MNDEADLTIDAEYTEVVALDDGPTLRLRLLCPDDRDALLRGFEQLSEESRYRRFLTPKSQLSKSELEYLTEIDQYNHVALGAELADEDRDGEGVGVARCVRLGDAPTTAEAAVTVLDEFQGYGIGTLLLRRLVAAARERGIDTFRATLFVENVPMRKILEEMGSVRVVERDGPVVTVDVSLEEEEPAPAPPDLPEVETPEDTPMRRIMSMTARGTASLVDKFIPDREDDGGDDPHS